jgi:hypothetical protein
MDIRSFYSSVKWTVCDRVASRCKRAFCAALPVDLRSEESHFLPHRWLTLGASVV